MKGLFGVGKVPPPAGASLAGTATADPLASLFAVDTVVKAPGIHDAPSEAELGRWRATMQSSLFEERVVDPAPQPPAAQVALQAPPPRGAAVAPPQPPKVASPRLTPPPSIALVAQLGVDEIDEVDDEVAERSPARQAEPRSEPPAPPAGKPRATTSTGRRRRAVAEAEAVAPAAEEPPAPVRRRRFERGPSRALLAALGIGAVSAVAALVIVLGPIGASDVAPSPAAARHVPSAAAAPPAAEPSAAVPLAAAAPPATPPMVPAAAAQPQAKSVAASQTPPAPAAPAPAAPAPAAPAPAAFAKPEPAAASTTAPAPAPATVADDEDERQGAPESLLRAGREALSADDAPGAERIARQALGQAPQDHHAMELLVLSLMDQDRGQDALPFARRMVQKRSRRVPYRLLLGDLLLMVGDESAARAEWQKALSLSPGDKAIKRRLGL